MNIKLNTICFILLFFVLITAVNATDDVNETLETVNQPDPNQDIDNVYEEKLQMNLDSDEVVSKSVETEETLSASKTTPTVVNSLIPITAKNKLKVNLKAPDVKMHYKDGTKFKVTLKDSLTKKAMKNTKVKIAINGVTYTKKTDSKGSASINLNLKSGTYNVVTTYDGSSIYAKKSVNSKVTIKSTIKCNDFTKYYKNTASYYSTFYDKKGKLLKNTAVKFKLNSKSYSVKTNKKGVAKLAINLKPGKYSISSINSKTSETITKSITIKSLIESRDLTMNDDDGSKFTVKILNSYGKASPNKNVILKTNGNTYTLKTNNNGQVSLPIDFEPGQYSITTEYDGLKNTNKITVNKVIKHTSFSHITSIPNYVNVTTPYVFHNSAYALKTGIDGIIRMSKNEVYTIQISETKGYLFTQDTIPGVDSTVIGYKTHLVPFDGSGVKSDYNKANLKGEGILISNGVNYTQIEYRSSTEENTELFGIYMDKGLQNSETITYIQNNRIKAMINFYTYNYDELGLQYNLAKYYGKSIYDFNYKSYDEITNNNANTIKFASTGEPVSFNYFGKSIVGYISKEDITTKMIINGIEELEKGETISYGLGEKYRTTLGFEVLQSYAIINEKINQKIVDYWISKSSGYLSRFGITNVYGMFLASLSTALMADEFANSYANEYDVKWKRSQTTTILGGMNLEKTYLHILNADMGMKVTGNNKNNIEIFKLINSMGLPELEKIALNPISNRFKYNSTSSLDNLYNNHGSYSIIFSGNLAMIQIDDSNTTIIINQSSGVANVIMKEEDFFYKGAAIDTINDCCSCNQVGNDMVNRLLDTSFRFFITNPLTYPHLKELGYEIGLLAHKSIPYILGLAGVAARGVAGVTYGIFGFVLKLQDVGTTYRSQQSQKEWYNLMDTYTFTRPGIFQQKKVYNIPNKNGGYDYVEAPIKSDFSLDRENTLYISNGKVRKLTKQETYNYYSDDYYSLFNVPPKYWNRS